MMTFHESYGDLPLLTLRLIKKFNVSQGDYDGVLYQAGYEYGDQDIDFQKVNAIIISHSETGLYRAPLNW